LKTPRGHFYSSLKVEGGFDSFSEGIELCR
jgi:hypothetical protein